MTEVLVTLAIVLLALAIVVCALQNQRHSGGPANRTLCRSNLKQLGIAMHNYHDAFGCFPPGLVDDDDDPADALHSGFLLLLPFIEEVALYNAYNFKAEVPRVATEGAADAADVRGASPQGWKILANSTVVSKQLAQFFCPSNRSEGLAPLGIGGRFAGGSDYALASGSIPLLCGDRTSNDEVARLRGVFGPNSYVKIKDIRDGTALTVAMSEIAGGDHVIGTTNTAAWQFADSDALNGNHANPKPWGIDQGWAMASIDGMRPNWPRGSLFVSAFQHFGQEWNTTNQNDGLPAAMNPKYVMISQVGQRPSDWPCGSRDDRLSPVRSQHEGGAQFLMCDGTVRFVTQTIDLRIYSAIFTIAGKEVVDEDSF